MAKETNQVTSGGASSANQVNQNTTIVLFAAAFLVCTAVALCVFGTCVLLNVRAKRRTGRGARGPSKNGARLDVDSTILGQFPVTSQSITGSQIEGVPLGPRRPQKSPTLLWKHPPPKDPRTAVTVPLPTPSSPIRMNQLLSSLDLEGESLGRPIPMVERNLSMTSEGDNMLVFDDDEDSKSEYSDYTASKQAIHRLGSLV